jgi:hypothetical protein
MVEKTEHGLVTVGEVVPSSMGSPEGSTFHLFASPPKKSNLNVTKILLNTIALRRIRNGNPSDFQDLVETLSLQGLAIMSPPQENFTCAKARVDPLSQYGISFSSFLERSCSFGGIRRLDPANTPETSRLRG